MERSLPKSVDRTCHIRTFGCQMNVHDSERMAGLLTSAGYRLVDDPDEASLIVVNTCTVRDKADQKALSDLGRLRLLKKGEGERILAVTGCMAEREQERLHRLMPEIDLVAGPAQVRNILPMVERIRSEKKHLLGRDFDLPEMTTPPALRPAGVTALVTVQEGCDKACSYCVVPRTRGPERSRPVASIVSEVRGLVTEGFREVILLGQNVNGYGKGSVAGEGFAALLYALEEVSGLLRIRFTTSHPSDLDDATIEAMARCRKVMPHLHLPVQSGSDRMLSLMERGYTLAQYRERVTRLREALPEVSLTTDLIVGFCHESEEDFSLTLEAVSEFRFDGAFCFIYSPRPGTPAYEWTGLPERPVALDRFRRLENTLSAIVLEKNRSRIGETEELLVERIDSEAGHFSGRSPHFRSVRGRVVEGAALPVPGQVVKVRIDACSKAGLAGLRE